MAEGLVLTMRAHTDMVTAIATPIDNSDIIVTASRDKSIILWNLTKEDKIYGVPRRRLTGHSHFVEDVVLSSDGQIALSGSWDCELRLWDLQAGVSARRFVGHTKDVLSVAFSIDNRQIVSASRDRTIKLWNTVGECKFTISDLEAHQDWVSCVLFSPNTLQPTIVLASWDKTLKVWNLTNCKIKNTLAEHTSTAVPTPTPPSSRETARVSAVAAAHASPILPPPAVARAFIEEMVVPTEATPHWFQSHRYHRHVACVNKRCHTVCTSFEGFHQGGKCRGFPPRCFCLGIVNRRN